VPVPTDLVVLADLAEWSRAPLSGTVPRIESMPSVPPLSRRERAALCDLLDDLGPDAATLCEGWNTYDLAAHLVLREGSPLAMPGLLLPQLEQLTDRGMARLKARVSYPSLVERVRQGPPRLSPLRPGKFERMANTIEYFVHHEDVRRAQPDWQARPFTDRDQDRLWSRLVLLAKGLARGSSVGVELVRTDAPAVRRIKAGEPTLVVRGLPTELTLFTYGRGAVADVDLEGDDAARSGFAHREFGI
jgi:uncharacterized protein (TIGR03085 family)